MKSKEIERNQCLLLGIYKPAEGCRIYCMFEYRLQRMSTFGLKNNEMESVGLDFIT